MEGIKKANAYIRENSVSDGTMRMKYHLMPPVGWMNDPNGLIWLDGMFHAHYQFYPYDSKWGPMHWGHATSKDFIEWKHEGVVMAPDEEYEDGCFSGGAIERDGNVFVYYTSHSETYGQNQSLAFFDGHTYRKYEQNPTLSLDDLPENANERDFRDPRPCLIGDDYYLAIGSKTKNDQGQVLLYKSQDMIGWDYHTTIGPFDFFGEMVECPDLFEMDDRLVLVFSTIEDQTEMNRFKAKMTTGYLILNRADNIQNLEVVSYGELDSGRDFYAPQTFPGPDGQRMLMSWFEMWDQKYPSREEGWVGALSFPRVLTLKEDKLIQTPLEIPETYRKNRMIRKNVIVSKEGLDLRVGSSSFLECRFNKSERWSMCFGNRFKINYEGDRVTIVSNTKRILSGRYSEELQLKIFLDVCSIELFVNDGVECYSERVYSIGNDLKITGDVIIESLELFDIIV